MANLEIKSIDVESAAKVCGLIGAIIGLAIGVIFAVVGAFAALTTPFLGGLIAGVGVLAVILSPIFYGVIGLICGIAGALLYNFSVGYVGGIKYSTK